jgi:hypothetical protein
MLRIEVWEQCSQQPPALSGLFEGEATETRFWAETYADEVRLRWSRHQVDGEVTLVSRTFDEKPGVVPPELAVIAKA